MVADLIKNNSEQFEGYPFKDKKEIILIIENSLRSDQFDINEDTISKFKYSSSILERIAYYLKREYGKRFDPEDDVINMIQEYERIKSSPEKKSLTPLHYSIRQIKKGIIRTQNFNFRKDDFFLVYNFLKKRDDLDKDDTIKNNLISIMDFGQSNEPSKREIVEVIKSLIEAGNTFKAIRLMLDNIKFLSLDESEVILLSSRLNRKKSSYLSKLISDEEYDITHSKISLQVLDLIKQ